VIKRVWLNKNSTYLFDNIHEDSEFIEEYIHRDVVLKALRKIGQQILIKLENGGNFESVLSIKPKDVLDKELEND